MKQSTAYDDAVDLLDADHHAVKKMFMHYGALCDDKAPADQKQELARRICHALTEHAQLEEELFYPAVRKAIGDDAMIDAALAEHAKAKDTIARIEDMKATSVGYDATVIKLGKFIDQHVLKEREQMFLKARLAALDLRGLTLPMVKRQQQLKKKSAAASAKEAA